MFEGRKVEVEKEEEERTQVQRIYDHLVTSSLGEWGCWREKVVARVEEVQASVVSSVPGIWGRLYKDLLMGE